MRTFLLAPLLAALLVGSAAAPAAGAGSARSGGDTATEARAPGASADRLKKNSLYKAGRLKKQACPEKRVAVGSAKSAASYLRAVEKCLDRAWHGELKKIRVDFERPSLHFITKPRRDCGGGWGKNAQAAYCSGNHHITVLLNHHLLDESDTLALMFVLGHEYGHHVQNLTGILAASAFGSADEEADAADQQSRRLELQADCLSGVFISSVWKSLDRNANDWGYLRWYARATGDDWSDSRDHGTGESIDFWLRRGYKAGSPSACNTWAAPAKRVA